LVFRDGKTKTLMVTLGQREKAENVAFPVDEADTQTPVPEDTTLFGLTVMSLNDELREQLDVAPGIDGLAIVAVDEASEAFAKGLRSGDVIVEAGQEVIASADDLQARADSAREAGRKTVLLLVRRAGEPRFVALGIDE
jgi:serine protease Do